MSQTSKAISEEMLSACKSELRKQGITGGTGRRLKGIISAKKYGIRQVLKVYNISRETLMRWIRRFKEGGIP